MVNANPKSIELYVLVDGNEVPFYGRSYAEFVLSNGDTFVTKDGFVFNVVHSNEQVKVGSFRYDAKRMGGAPIITFTLMYDECLDKLWSDQVYAKFRGERYFLKQTPTSSKNNDDARYRHDVELIAERTILDNAYFYDAVVGSPIENDVPVTNSTKFHFYGHIEKFVERMNASLQYTGIQKVDEDGNVVSGYHVVLDDDVVKRDQKQVSFDSAVFSQALQESYNTFGIPFYFDGQTIHIGFTNNVIGDVLEYGVDGALISATKTNANFKVINRATGEGSSENIPYYYPNNAPKGEIIAETNRDKIQVSIIDYEAFSNEVGLNESLVFRGANYSFGEVERKIYGFWIADDSFTSQFSGKLEQQVGLFRRLVTTEGQTSITFSCSPRVSKMAWETGDSIDSSYHGKVVQRVNISAYKKDGDPNTPFFRGTYVPQEVCEIDFSEAGEFYIECEICVRLSALPPNPPEFSLKFVNVYIDYYDSYYSNVGWYLEGTKVELNRVGLSVLGDTNIGDSITQRLIKKVNTSSTLQPSIYRATDGKERFYNAINYPFPHEEGYELKYGEYVLDGEVHNDAYKKDDGTYYEFTNEYKEGRPREHVFTVDDIKPTIKEATNNISWVETDEEGNDKTVFQRIDMFSEFAYNIGDNDETYTTDDNQVGFKHPYFFGKLRKLDFNLFEHASELGEMTFSMTSGNCGACNFKIGVSDDYPQFNTVQVDENGNLVYDENGYVLCGLEDFQGKVEPQDRQQDTVNYEVWVALKKEEDTYGILMPKAPVDGIGGHRPVACSSENANDGDTFVILNVNLPDEYVYRAEKKLEKAIVKYIWENNVEKFNFSVNFSRIFLEENYLLKGDESVLSLLNENARLTRVKYNGDEYILYVSSYSYSMNDGDVLPEIRVELDDTLTIAQNALQTAIDGVKSDIASAINAIDVAAIGSRYFLRKDIYDVAEAPIEFKKGVVFGDNGMVEVNEDGTSKLTIDYLDVTRKATFTSLEIQEKSHVGGEILITPASMVCNKVEELEDAYRCYFETYGESGEEIFNQFAEGDQAISQTFNEWGGHYYWRLVTGIGEDYIDLSKSDCAPESDVPKVGDKIIQLGNRTNTTRQAAQVLSSHGENAPSFIMYNGIDSFSLEGKEVTGIEWNAEKQEPQMYSYGSFYFGDRNLEDNFITFQKKEGDEKKSLHINADITIGANSSGLTNLSEWSSKQQEIDNAEQKAQDAIDATNVVSASVTNLSTTVSTLETNVNKSIQDINQKLDGVVESYFDDYIPSRTNLPASEWVANGTEEDHVGDTFTNTALEGEGAGQSWRWLLQEDGSYDWQQIADSDAAKALALAGQAKATADGKNTTFLVKPTNYGEGDTWIVGEDYIPNGYQVGDILTSNGASESYFDVHWSKIVRYTDDTKASEALSKATELVGQLNETEEELRQAISLAEENANEYTDEAKSALQQALDNLDEAKASVESVNAIVGEDGLISEAEQRAIDAAEKAAKAAQVAAETTASAYADGVAEQAEKDAINASNEALAKAKGELEDAIAEVEDLAIKAQQDVNDLQYLSQTFDSVVDVDGVVMSKMVAVKNESGEVESLINGDSNFAHSLMIAAGIPEKVTVNNKDSVDLEERAIKAKFKVYEDGTLSATDAYISGQINATDGGKIGPMNIYDYGLSMIEWPDDITVGRTFPTVVLGLETFSYATMRAHNSNNATSVKGVTISNNDIVTSPSILAYKNNEYCNSNYAAIEAECEGGDASKRYAFRARNGMFAGLRPRTRTITSSTPSSELKLTPIDHTIIAEASCTLYLPEAPQIGQRYEIIKLYSIAVEIDPQGVQVYSMPDYNGNNGLGTNVAKLGTGAFLKATYIYTGSKWIRMIESYS